MPESISIIVSCIQASLAFRRFLLRGIEKVLAEWALICTAYNLTKLAGAA
jgi:hypothetical protein